MSDEFLYPYALESDEEGAGNVAIDGEHGRLLQVAPNDARTIAYALLESAGEAEGTDTEAIVFHWSRNHGDCVDCGNPAAFISSRYVKAGEPQVPEERARLCALCAANDAADGEIVRRIEEHW